jgi:hypothetical protein
MKAGYGNEKKKRQPKLTRQPKASVIKRLKFLLYRLRRALSK